MRHEPVLLKETLELLDLKPNDNVVDCTLGDAGHSEAILEKTGPKGKLLGIDLDTEAVLRAKRFLYRFEDRAIIVRNNFNNLKKIVDENKFAPVNAILMDLGWSSPQFAERGRGFSFQTDEPLDMRYNAKSEIRNPKSETDYTAADIVNIYSEKELADIFKNFGEENLNKEIAKAIVDFRKRRVSKDATRHDSVESKKIEKSGELAEIILQVYRTKLHTDKEIPWIGGLHPATKVFQALRMEVNHELENLKQALPQAVEMLASGGRLAVITFHSLEDRIVKQYFQTIAGKKVRLVNKKPISGTEEEIKLNPRSRSAKLRVIKKL
ncbi:MAG: Ribosomal RNA small subunit methyltransferase H [Candidatus Magasanikbacteria bacterium GW2011_GWA2_40_10]|uniref:Ribosomal RNA small subunit methyltransferase H n=1 Tax=Candidatus Magasanikbacteria bacterium GW2011_GWA2_40_10 TaxID=1619037 RepID=A0A0G0Q288_9BACT|nr:MAG: Ribosomal RNA small subunit methyltransferase H [Candidatus Magasanikbacteria bacterium GW2011_GWA2_40_10]